MPDVGGSTAMVCRQQWGRARRTVLAVALVLAGVALAVGGGPTGRAAPRVLVISSYGPDSPWSAELSAGVRETLAGAYPQAVLTLECMPAEPVSEADGSRDLAEAIQQAHAQSRFAAAIVADDAAFAFAMAVHDRLLPGVPLVFCGVSDLPPHLRSRHRLVTGVVLTHDVRNVMASALKRHPGARALVVVHDLSAAGLAYREQMQAWADDIARRRPDMVVAFLSAEKYSTLELIEQIRALPLDCLVLLTSWSQDRDRQPEQLDDVLARIARVSPVPVYGVTGANSGFVDATARFAEARRQGAVAGTMVAKILRGVPPSEIPIRVIRAEANLEAGAPLEEALGSPAAAGPVAGGGLARRFSHGLLPAVGVVAVALQLVLIGMLFAAVHRRRVARREAAGLHRRLDLVVDCAGLGLFDWDLDTGAMTFNARYAESLGYLPEQIEATRAGWEAMVHPDDLPAVMAALQAFLDDRAPSYAVSYRLRTRAGAYARVYEHGEVTARHPDGSPSRFLGVHVVPGFAADRGPGRDGGPAAVSVA